MLERGNRDTRPVARPDDLIDFSGSTKVWPFTIAFGGGSNCWWGNTPRMLPADFEMKSRFGVARDWPMDYATLEPFYCEAEEIMMISGEDRIASLPRSRPFPQPPHRPTDPERFLRDAYPDQMVALPTSRARLATATRPACCARGVCHACPINAKFTIAGDMSAIYDDPRVTLKTGAEVLSVISEAGAARGVTYRTDGRVDEIRADAVALGTNAFFNAAILLQSGLDHPLLGRRLHEQVGMEALVVLRGLDNFQGSTSITGHGYMLYDAIDRREAAACLIETWNVPRLLPVPGRFREKLQMKFVFETLPRAEDRISLSTDRPSVTYAPPGLYSEAGLERVKERLPEILKALPVESVHWNTKWEPTEAHNLGTVVMGDDPADSVVNHQLKHHKVDGLWVLGGSAFPSGAPANPTLTISALSLRAAALA